MNFRPCIDIHNGKVKQIVGSSLKDDGDTAKENFVAERSAREFALLFRNDGLRGGHVILLNSRDSEHYETTRREALSALEAYPGGLQVGGGVTAANAVDWIRAGASHVIVTSYVFKDGKIDFAHLKALVSAVGKTHIVLDLSCRKKPQGQAEGAAPSRIRGGRADTCAGERCAGAPYYIMTDRWQKWTDTVLDTDLLCKLAAYCDEVLVHGIASEGKGQGFDAELVRLLGGFSGRSGVPVTYAGGIRSLDDIRFLERIGGGFVDYTVGSALDLYGGTLPYSELVRENGKA